MDHPAIGGCSTILERIDIICGTNNGKSPFPVAFFKGSFPRVVGIAPQFGIPLCLRDIIPADRIQGHRPAHERSRQPPRIPDGLSQCFQLDRIESDRFGEPDREHWMAQATPDELRENETDVRTDTPTK